MLGLFICAPLKTQNLIKASTRGKLDSEVSTLVLVGCLNLKRQL